MRRLAIVLLLCLALPASAAAQGGAFGPLPQPQAPVETPTPVEAPADQSTISRGVLFGIAGAVLVAFVAIGLYISRDARQHLTEADRRALERGSEREPGEPGERVRDAQAKKKARAKAKAQRQARKKQRSR